MQGARDERDSHHEKKSKGWPGPSKTSMRISDDGGGAEIILNGLGNISLLY
jgi:hypothetical protein